jgi:hypothetical protein
MELKIGMESLLVDTTPLPLNFMARLVRMVADLGHPAVLALVARVSVIQAIPLLLLPLNRSPFVIGQLKLNPTLLLSSLPVAPLVAVSVQLMAVMQAQLLAGVVGAPVVLAYLV